MKLRYLTLILAALCLLWMQSGLAQSQQQNLVEASRGKGEFNWNITVAIDVVKESPFFVGSRQEEGDDYFNISVLLDIYYRGFFIQTNKYRYSSYISGVELGYELVVNDDYEIDLISKVYLPAFSSTLAGTRSGREIEALEGINDREALSHQGVRYMRYLPNVVYWLDVAADLFDEDHGGWLVDGFYSHILQKRNWDISLGAGVSFFSSKMNNYYFSVQPEEARDNRPVYRAGSGYRLQLEAAFQHPIRESWLFNGGVTLSHYSSSIGHSPLVKRNNSIRAQVGVSYVF